VREGNRVKPNPEGIERSFIVKKRIGGNSTEKQKKGILGT